MGQVIRTVTATALALGMSGAVVSPSAANDFWGGATHNLSCFGKLLSDPAGHAIECGTNDFDSGAGGTNYQGAGVTEAECLSRPFPWTWFDGKCEKAIKS